jgi:hypothetical protein
MSIEPTPRNVRLYSCSYRHWDGKFSWARSARPRKFPKRHSYGSMSCESAYWTKQAVCVGKPMLRKLQALHENAALDSNVAGA